MQKKVVALGVGLAFLFKINQGQFCPFIKVLGAPAIVMGAPRNTLDYGFIILLGLVFRDP